MMTNETKWKRVAIAAGIVAAFAVIVAAHGQRSDAAEGNPEAPATSAPASSRFGTRTTVFSRIVDRVQNAVTIQPEETRIPAGTTVAAKITTHVSTRDAKQGDAVTAVTTENILVKDRVVIPSGTTVSGRVIEVQSAAQTRSKAVLRVAFDRIGSQEASLALASPDLALRAQNANRAADAALVVGGVVAGAVIGRQVSSRRGTVVGGVVGGATGGAAAANLGANVQLLLNEPAVLRFTEEVVVR